MNSLSEILTIYSKILSSQDKCSFVWRLMILLTINLSSLMWVKMKSFIKVILSDVIYIRFPQPCLIFISTSKKNSTLHSTLYIQQYFYKKQMQAKAAGSRSWSFLSRVDGLVGNTKLSMSCLLWMSWNVKTLIIDLYCSPLDITSAVVLVSFIVSRPLHSNCCGSLSRVWSGLGSLMVGWACQVI